MVEIINEEEKEFKVHWTLKGTSTITAKDKNEAFEKSMKDEDISDPNSEYSVEYVE